MPQLDKIIILDFGSQYTQLISRRVREMHVYSEILPPDTSADEILKIHPKGIILSGAPSSAHEVESPLDIRLLQADIPLLGICFGMQLMNHLHQGTVKQLGRGEYGRQLISLSAGSPLFKGLGEKEQVWMSHGDSIAQLASCYQTIGESQDGLIAAIQHRTLPHFGLQFHPEVAHTLKGNQILGNFLDICQCRRDWSIGTYVEDVKQKIREKVKGGRVVSLVSGGVDSTCATSLCYEALGPEKVYALHIDNGFMRANESQEVVHSLRRHGIRNLIHVDASKEFLAALRGVSQPEEKRKKIGTLFIEILEREVGKLESHSGKTFFCQGTLYTDLIESGKGCGKHAKVIKTHHNVNPPLVEEKRKQGLIIEPNAGIFKDEVRQVCETLGVPPHLVWRHPFPGPGLAIRILGEVTEERLNTLRKADQIFLEELHKAGLYSSIWQAFAVLLPVTTVGVMGDKRTEGNAIALRAVTSSDGMTADCFPMPYEVLTRISSRIVNETPSINRVTYDITSKPPGTIEWE